MKKTLIAATLVTLVPLCVRADGSSTSTQTGTTTTDTTVTTTAPTVESPNTSPYTQPAWEKRFGIGAIFGEPTGVSGKFWINENMAIDGVVGWGFYEESEFYTHADVLWHLWDVIPVSRGRMPIYFGVGPRLKVREHEDDRFGVRFPVGVSYMFDNAPVDIFFEVAPILDLSPNTHGAFTAGIGVRYWF